MEINIGNCIEADTGRFYENLLISDEIDCI